MITSTELELVYDVSGIENSGFYSGRGFEITPNVPNPFSDMTQFDLFLQERGTVEVTVGNTIGQNLTAYKRMLEAGKHTFSFYPGKDKLYILTANFKGITRSLKMISSGKVQSADAGLVYSGVEDKYPLEKVMSVSGGFQFAPGDLLRFTGFASTPTFSFGSGEIEDTPMNSQEYNFEIAEGFRCPGMPTITDIDGNVYNTVLIGDQCWMKENLRTTTYENGTPIPNVTDQEAWTNLTSGAYVWYDNNINWKGSYGALYNWRAAVDTNSLCPTGWHVPTKQDWITLTDFIGGEGVPYGNMLKSCRQVNSSIGGSCNSIIHPRWSQDNTHFGTDDFGFSGLPGGFRYVDGFWYIGNRGYWWSSVDGAPTAAWYFHLNYLNGEIFINLWDFRFGFSVRCLED